MHFYEYNGFTIYPTPRLLLDSNMWMVTLLIRHGDRIKTITTDYSFGTKGEAAFHCIQFGKRIIDGAAEGFTVNDFL